MSESFPANIPRFNEHHWVMTIRETLENKLEEFSETPVCIFSVPKAIMASDPESYIPQQVPIGPYHCWRPEMYEMERYKLAAAKRMQQHLENHVPNIRLEDVVHQLNDELEPKIRACYHKYLTISGEALAWMMVVDACFLLEFLRVSTEPTPKDAKTLNEATNSLFRDMVRGKLAKNGIVRDIVKLENQIPLFILRKMLETKFGNVEVADDELFLSLMKFSENLCPFKKLEELKEDQAMNSPHLLGFLYRLVMPRPKSHPVLEIVLEEPQKQEQSAEGREGEEEISRGKKIYRMLLDEFWKIMQKLNHGPIRVLKKIIFNKVVVFITKLPWTIISHLPGVSIFIEPIKSVFESNKDEDNQDGDDEDDDGKPPLVEEIAVPSVTELFEAYVNFAPVEGGISSIKFDTKTRTLYLPVIYLDENTETIMRNLVAYEQCHATGPVFVTRYTEFMNGIIDTEEDARLLREKGIIVNRLKTDEEVTKLWNGMCRSVRLTKAPLIDRLIEDVNHYYSQRWKGKLRNFMRAYVFGSWQFLTLLACIALLLLTGLQAFCSVYDCHRFFPVDVADQPAEQ